MASSNNIHDVPPPPYSETDIYSQSGGGRSPVSQRSNSLSHPHQDSGSMTGHSVDSSSAGGEVIYTPPLTPRSSNHQQNFVGPALTDSQQQLNFVAPHVADTQQQNFVGPGLADHLTTASAAAYFDSRPPPRRTSASAETLLHTIAVRPGCSPDDFPYPEAWAQRDVTREDWQTFINYLIPHHAAESNENLIDRKMRAENDAAGSRGVGDTKEAEARPHAEAHAQLEQIRSRDDAGARNVNSESTVREWNEGFFSPRGLHVQLSTASPRMPGGWDTSFDQEGGANHQPTATTPGGGGYGSGFRFAGIHIDGDRLALGNNVVADPNGLRIGRLSLGEHGISYGGRNILPGSTTGPRGFDSGGGGGGPWCGITEPHRHEDGQCKGTRQDRPRGRGRGRHRERRGGPGGGGGRHRSRSSSASSTSSSSSSDSSSSESSVGSLPAYSDLKDTQLPITKSFLQKWLDAPDAPITKESVKTVAKQIKEARRNPAAAAEAGREADLAALRGDVKDMMREWKAMKKAQAQERKRAKKERKAERKARKAKRRQEKKERKATRKEMRNSRREFERERERERWGGGPRGRHHHPHHHDGPPHHHPQEHGFGPPPPPGAWPHFPHPHPPPPPPPPGEMPPSPGGMFGPRGIFGGGRAGGRGNCGGGGGGGPWARAGGGGGGGGFFGNGPRLFQGGFGREGRGGPFGWGGGPFGGGRGHGPFRGGPGGPPPPFGSGGFGRAPGSWPGDGDDPHADSAAMLKEIEAAEQEVAGKAVELTQMKEQLEKMRQSRAAPRARGGDEEAEAEEEEEDEKVRAQRIETEQFETEIELLRHNIQIMRMEADERYAQELAGELQKEI